MRRSARAAVAAAWCGLFVLALLVAWLTVAALASLCAPAEAQGGLDGWQQVAEIERSAHQPEDRSYLTDRQRVLAGITRPSNGAESEAAVKVAEAPATREMRLRDALHSDASVAERLVPAIVRWGGHLQDGEVYDIALAIARETRQRYLRPELVVALIKVESGYSIHCVSPTNDHGLMQLHGDPTYAIEANIASGCMELATWRDTYHCGEREMLAHYNGGCRPPGVSWGYADRVLGLSEEVVADG